MHDSYIRAMLSIEQGCSFYIKVIGDVGCGKSVATEAIKKALVNLHIDEKNRKFLTGGSLVNQFRF